MPVQFPGATLGANTFTGAQAAPSLALGGATIGSNALAVTGTQLNSGYIQLTGVTTSPVVFGAASNNLYLGANGNSTASTATVALLQDGVSVGLKSTGIITFSSDTTPFGTADLFLKRNAAANLQLGAAAVDTAPVAQTLSVQNTLAGGTSNVAGALWTFQDSAGKGSATSGGYAFQTHPAGSSGTVVNTAVTALAIAGSGAATFASTISTTGFASTGSANVADAGFFYWLTRGGFSATGNGAVRLLQSDNTTAGAFTTGTVSLSIDRSLILTNQTSSAGAQVGTLTNAPAAGNPGYWLKVTIGGVSYALPAWAG